MVLFLFVQNHFHGCVVCLSDPAGGNRSQTKEGEAGISEVGSKGEQTGRSSQSQPLGPIFHFETEHKYSTGSKGNCNTHTNIKQKSIKVSLNRCLPATRTCLSAQQVN